MKLNKIEISELKERLQNDIYNLIYINYESENGIKIFANEGNPLNFLSEKELEKFYKIYIFNKNFMGTIYRFDDNEIRYTEIQEDNLKIGQARERSVLIDLKRFKGMEKYERVKVKILKLRDSEEELVKFEEFEKFTGGEENDRKSD